MTTTINNSKDKKSKSNKESILINSKCLEPVTFAQELERCNFLPKSSFEHLGSKSRTHQATLVLFTLYRTIQSYKKKYQEFVEILRRHNSAAADALTNPVDGPTNNTGSVYQHIIKQYSNLLIRFEEKMKSKLKRNPDVALVITDNLIECGILDFDGVYKILHSQREAHELVECIIANIHRGAYNPLLETLKSKIKLKGLASELATADIKTDHKKQQFYHKSELPVLLDGLPENPKLNGALLDRRIRVDVAVSKEIGSIIENKNEGSVMLRFRESLIKNLIAGKNKIQREVMSDVTYDAMKYMDSSALEGVSQCDVMLKCFNNKINNMSTTIQPLAALPPDVSTLQNIPQALSEQQATKPAHHATELAQHTMNATIIAANRSYLIEEINTMALVRAFKDNGITCFDGLDGTLGRQQRAEDFLTILETNNLLDQLLDILREQGMTYVLDRLNNCRNAYSADPQILERNIFNNRSNIFNSLDIDDVREIFIEREVFTSRMFDEIEVAYSGSEYLMPVVLMEIIKSGQRAMQILVDALYMNQADSLADSILRVTPNEWQEMQDNTKTDESSSDGE